MVDKFQMVFTSSCVAILQSNYAGTSSMSLFDSELPGGPLNWEIHLLIFQTKSTSEKTPTSLLYNLEEKSGSQDILWLKRIASYGSIHHYMTEGWGAECTMWDSVLCPPQLLFTLGAFFSQVGDCPAAELLCLSSQSPAALCDFISMHLTWVTCLCWGGGRGALTLHCREAFKLFKCSKKYFNVFQPCLLVMVEETNLLLHITGFGLVFLWWHILNTHISDLTAGCSKWYIFTYVAVTNILTSIMFVFWAYRLIYTHWAHISLTITPVFLPSLSLSHISD